MLALTKPHLKGCMTFAIQQIPIIILLILLTPDLARAQCAPDTTDPVISCPGDITLVASPDTCGAFVGYSYPSAIDSCTFGTPHPDSLAGFTYMGTFNGHSYFLSDSAVPAEYAASNSIVLGGHLVTINDSAENALLVSFTGNEFWIGLADTAVEGVFEWITGEPLGFTSWAPGEPNNFKDREHWGTSNYLGLPEWNDRFGNEVFQYIVEFDPVNAVPVTLISGPPVNGFFPVGTTTVIYEAEDSTGNTAQCSFDVTVLDTLPPIAICKDFTLYLDSVTATATLDPIDIDGGSLASCGNLILSASKTNFTYADLGTHTVTLTVTDSVGRMDSCEATVTVPDTVPLVITCPTDTLVVSSDSLACGANVNFEITATGAGTVIDQSADSGDFFPIGTTMVSATATNAANQQESCSFYITVYDSLPPFFTFCPGDVNVQVDSNGCDATVNYPEPTASDNCDPGIHPASLPGFTLLGTFNDHTYFLSNSQATNANANATAQSFGAHLVTIADSAENALVASFTGSRIWIGFNDTATEGVFEWVTGEPVTYTNWDTANGEPNNFNGAEDWTVMNFNSANGLWNDYRSNNNTTALYVIEFDPSTFPVSLISGPPSGSVFPFGSTEIVYQTTDPYGNTATCSFNVVVSDSTGFCNGDSCVQTEIIALDLVGEGYSGFIRHLQNGETVIKANHPDGFSIEAIPCDGPVGSVVFNVNGNNVRTESVAPYAISGDSPVGFFDDWDPNPGIYTILATPYTNSGGKGSPGIPYSLTITVIDSGLPVDCNGDTLGSAFLNACDSCVGGNTGNPIDYGQDDCGVCNGGNTDKDCNGDCFGTAVIDSCGLCVLGNTGIGFNDSCDVDCAGVTEGTAELDSCGICAGGTTGLIPNADKDTCGVCFGDNFSCAPCVPLEIVSLALVDANTSTDITNLTNGYIIDKSLIVAFSIRADACDEPSVGSVEFLVNGATVRIENAAPFAIKGDNASGYKEWDPPAGNYTIEAIPYSGNNAKGTQGVSKVVNISVIDGAPLVDCNGDLGGTAFVNACDSCVGGNTGNPVDYGTDDCGICNGNNNDKDCNGDCFGSAVIDSCGVCALGNTGVGFNDSCDVDCAGVIDGLAFLDDCGECVGGTTGLIPNYAKDTCGVCFGNNFSCATCQPLEIVSLTLMNTGLGGPIRVLNSVDTIIKSQVGTFNVRADVCSDTAVGSVLFFQNGSQIQKENNAPYALAGDASGSYYSWNIAAGNYTITATPYSGNNGAGTQGISEIVDLWVFDTPPIPPASVANSNSGNQVGSDRSGSNGVGNSSGVSSQNPNVSTESTLEMTMDVYPNPTSGNLTVEVLNADRHTELRMVNGSGKIVYINDFNRLEELIKLEIDLSKNPKGIYMLQLRNGDNIITKTVIKN